jgi:Protein of unknown function (DUF998)
MTISAMASSAKAQTDKCDPRVAITKSLLGYGILAMPFYVIVSVIEGAIRPGFDFTTHDWSLLANGHLGWIHITNLILTGLMTVAFAGGLARSTGSAWTGRLVTLYGIGLIGAGVVIADPAHGFPAGSADGAGSISWHGAGHMVSATIGFAGLIAACFVLARHYSRRGDRAWAWFTRTTGAVFALSFLGIAGSGGAAASVLAFTAAVLLVTVWSAATAVHEYQRAH